MISARLDKLRSAEKYFHYIQNVTGVTINEEALQRYYEIKATRNLIVHRRGIIDQIYINAAGKYHRGKLEEKIKVDYNYLSDTTEILNELFLHVMRI